MFQVSAIYLRSFWVLKHCFSVRLRLRQFLSTHSKPKKGNLEVRGVVYQFSIAKAALFNQNC